MASNTDNQEVGRRPKYFFVSCKGNNSKRWDGKEASWNYVIAVAMDNMHNKAADTTSKFLHQFCSWLHGIWN